ncbi:TrkA C-terminal domain-containing protein [Massilia sp. CFBP9012]|uniref:aspartate:alanine exchanger family transporter n=1 Tax=Massilia sp. CFBP9012 TaxID=3096531 RepID=UPI002A6A3E76|nr:TrkA C-terminal domain-containing protein [Massilia sp. CFBP9012]MDY0976213.1 TrkA C-terminal domain-containing protein [Massilia sp. CFBP9012]
MEFIKNLLEQQPLVALFLVIAIGYLAGEINIKGFSLGAGAVLFVALAVGWFAPQSAPSPMVGTLGLAMFLYAIGIQYGKQFFIGLSSMKGLKANVMALTGVALAGAVSVLFIGLVTPGHALGLFAGAGTSTATLQAAMTTLGNNDAAVGYSVAYPFGVAVPILILYLTFLIMKPKVEQKSANLELLEIALRNPQHIGRKLGEVMTTLPAGIQIVALRHQHHNLPASPDIILGADDVVLAIGPDQETLDRVRIDLGEAAPGRISADRSDIDYIRLFASKPAVIGHRLGELALPGGPGSLVVHVRRGDADMLPARDLVLEPGDRVGVFAHRDQFAALRKYFGDSIKATAELSYISIGLGMALGLIIGLVSVTMPGLGKVSFGLAGVLIAALVLGKLRRTGRVNWTIPLPANLVMRNLGLTLFLAQVGMSAGPKFAATVSATGFLMLGLATVAVLALVLPVLLMGLFMFKMPYDEVAGIVAGATGNPAIVAYANKLAPTDQPDVGYAMIFPGMTIVKILFVNLIPALLL